MNHDDSSREAAQNNKLPKHHFVPVFYLRKWAAGDGRVVEFSRPYGPTVKPRRVHPDGTGYVRGLYWMHGLPPDRAEYIESVFLKKADDFASYAQMKLLQRDLGNWSAGMRSAWSRFIVGLLLRSPETVKEIKAKMTEGLPEMWETARQRHAQENPNEPPFGDVDLQLAERMGIYSLQRFIDNPTIGSFLNNMEPSVVDVGKSKYSFLTSDHPIVMTNGLNHNRGHVAIAISPTMLYIATRTEEFRRSLQAMDTKELVSNYNKQVVRNAVTYVWAHDESQSALILSQMSFDAHKNVSFFGVGRFGTQAPRC